MNDSAPPMDSWAVALVAVDHGGRIVRCTDPACALLGGCAPGLGWSDCLMLGVADSDPDPVATVLAGTADSADGIVHLVSGRVVRATVQRVGDGLHLVLCDLTDAWPAIRERRRDARLSLDACRMARVGAWVVPLEAGGQLVWSDEVKRIHEVPLDYVPTLPAAIAFYAPEARLEVERYVRAAVERGESWDFVLPIITARGRRIWVRAQGHPEYENGEVVRVAGTFQDVDEQVRSERERAEAVSRAQLSEQLFEMADGLMSISDDNARFVRVNQGWSRALGYSRQELTARRFLDFVHPDDVERTADEVRRLASSAEPTEGFINRYRHKDGHYLWLAWNARRDPVSGLTYAVASNITAIQRQSAELARLAREADRANRAKSAFLATMSHEIRTPMNGVLGMAQLLLGTPLNGHQRAYVDNVRTTGSALLTIINDILDFSKIEAGKLDLELVPFELARVFRDVIQLQLPIALAKGVVIQLDLAPDLPEGVRGDPGRIRQVLLNLVGNAVKFTDVGAVMIRARRQARTIRVMVEDTGPGIPEHRQAALFAPFAQADVSTRRRFGGTGLGLAISRQLVELMGGRIGMVSVEGQGATFWFELPLTEAPLPEPDSGAILPDDPAPGRGLRVLVVEDNTVNQMVAGHLLSQLGCEVDTAGNGQEALVMTRDFHYDLVFMDCRMPVMDGFEATRRLRARPGGEAMPVIALTANAMQGDRERCLSVGMDDYLSKPIAADALHRMVSRWRGRSRS